MSREILNMYQRKVIKIDNSNVKSENGIMKSESVNEVVGFEEVMFTQTEAKE